MNPEITYNQEKNGIELRFIEKPDATTLSELKKMRFRFSFSKTMWYAPITDERIEFAKQLQQMNVETPSQELHHESVTSSIKQKEKQSASSSKTEDTQQSIFHHAFHLLDKLIPDLVKHLKAGASSGVLEVEKDNRHRKIRYDLTGSDSESPYEIILSELTDEKEELQYDVLVYPDKEEAHVTATWFSHYYQGKYGRQDDEQAEDSDDDEGQVMTESMNEWLTELLHYGYSITIEKQLAKADNEVANENNATRQDKLANEHGVYTDESAGNKFEHIEIPIPKTAKWEVQINVVEVSESDFRFGVHLSKHYDNYEGTGFYPNTESHSYPSRKEAIKAALQSILHRVKPSPGKQEDRKANHAAEAIIKFAQGEGIELTEKSQEEKHVVSATRETKSIKASLDENHNQQIEKLLSEKGNTPFSEEEKKLIGTYTHHLEDAKTKIPETILELLWKLAFKYNYHQGDVLVLCVGTGDLLRHAPEGVSIFAFEQNHNAARIAQVLYPNIKIVEQLPEANGSLYELVIGGFPCGKQFEKLFTHGLELVKAGGLLIFLLPVTFMQGPASKAKEEIAIKSQIMDAYHLQSMDCDIIILRKKEIL